MQFSIMKSRGLTDEDFNCNYVNQIWFKIGWMLCLYDLNVYIRSSKVHLDPWRSNTIDLLLTYQEIKSIDIRKFYSLYK